MSEFARALPPDDADVVVEALEDSPVARERLAGFLRLQHPVVPAPRRVEIVPGFLRLTELRHPGVPLARIRLETSEAAAVLLQAACALLFFHARGFPLESGELSEALVDVREGGPFVWMARLPRSAVRPPPAAEPPEAVLGAIASSVLLRRSGRRARREAGAERLLEALLAGVASPRRSDAWVREIFRSFPELGKDGLAAVRTRCPGFRAAGIDTRDRLDLARAECARVVLEGRTCRVFRPGASGRLPGSALEESLGSAGVGLAALTQAAEEAAESDTHWIRVDREIWDPASIRVFSQAASRGGIEVIEIGPNTGRLLPHDLREAVWIPAPDLASSVALYEALHAGVTRQPEGYRRYVARLVGSPRYAEFLDSGRIPDEPWEADPERARRDLAALTPAERRSVGLFLVHPDGATEGFSRAAEKLTESGWMEREASRGRFRVADPAARADLLAAYSPAEVREFCAARSRSEADPALRLDLALRGEDPEAAAGPMAELFGGAPAGSRRPSLDGLAELVVERLGSAAPAEVRLHEAERRAERGEHLRARELLEGILAGEARPDARREASLRLAAECEKLGDAAAAGRMFRVLAQDLAARPADRSRAWRGCARVALTAGELDRGQTCLERAREIPGLPASEELEIALGWADLHSRRGNLDLERDVYERNRARFREEGDEDLQVKFLLREGALLSDLHDDEGAARRFAEALQAAGPDPERRGSALMDLAISLDYLGQTARSEALFREAFGLFSRADSRVFARRALGNLASFFVNHHRYLEAEPLLARLEQDSRGSEDPVGLLVALGQRARVALRLGRFAEAARLRGRARELCEGLGDRLEATELAIEESDGRLFRGDPEGAWEAARAAAALPATRGPAQRWAAGRLADLQRWLSGVSPERALDGAGEDADPLAAAERLTRARAFFGLRLEQALPEECTAARRELARAGRRAFVDEVFSAGLSPADAERLRSLRGRLLAGELPLRLLDMNGTERWRSATFARAAWSREIVCEGRHGVLEGDGVDAEAAAFLFESFWSPPEEPSPGDGTSPGLEVLRRAGILAADPAMEALGQRLARIAAQNVTVFVTGESGTGKEKIARAVAGLSPRAAAPFVAVNVAAIPEHLLEDELFGHARGAFTGADRDRPGLFEAADRGTLFLDEIGDLPAPLQSKLLRVLQEREFRRLGENRFRRVDVRLICATARSLEREVEAGRFREDLYYRVKVATLEVPPLRRRGDDAVLLARHFLAAYAAEFSKGGLRLSAGALARIRSAPWPGNVRQLQNAMMQAAALSDPESAIGPEALALEPPGGPPREEPGGYRERVDSFRRHLVAEALSRHEGNRTHAARSLGLSRQALLYLIRELEIPASPSGRRGRG
jgi:transcriptional regulator with AAA-type ATPase domain